MTGGAITDSWAREIAQWTDKLPAGKRDEADAILLDAAAQGLSLEDLRLLARTIDEAWQAQHPDPDDGNGDGADEDGFGDRYLRLGATLDGAGALNGALTAGCTAALQAIFDSLGKHLGPQDHRSIEQRQHDALEEALQRLIKAGLLPDSAGQATKAQILINFADLRRPDARLCAGTAVDHRPGRAARSARLADRRRRRSRRLRRAHRPGGDRQRRLDSGGRDGREMDHRLRPGRPPAAVRPHLRRLHLHPAHSADR